MPYAFDTRTTALPRSLALSSLSYLTVVVLALLLRTLWPAATPTTIVLPRIDFIDHPVMPPVTPTSPGYVPPPQPVTPSNGRILPTDDALVKDAIVPDIPPTVAPPNPGAIEGKGDPTANPLQGGGTGPAPGIPEPGTFEYTETLPVLVRGVPAVYPDIARQAGIDGTVELWLRVNPDGHVHELRVASSVPMLDSAAVDAARQFVFTPATVDGHAVGVWVRQRFHFTLHD